MNSALDIERSEVNTTNNISKVFDIYPLLPATFKSKLSDRHFNMPDQWLPWAFFVSDFESKLLVCMLYIDVKEFALPSWMVRESVLNT